MRDAAYFGGAPGALFGWYHSVPSAVPRDCVVVICAPIGYEYTHSHRTVRHLADRLARHGIPALRFDYHGTGDSPGTDLAPGRLSRWKADIFTAVTEARSASGRKSVCLIGIRLGASLAALVAQECEIELLVMWNPCASGRTYLRELRAIAMTAERVAPDTDGALESAGYVLSAETIAALRKLDLVQCVLDAPRRTLLLTRDDQAPEAELLKFLATSGIPWDHESVPGWEGMMAEEQYTVIPDTALGVIVDWVVKHTSPQSSPPPTVPGTAGAPRREFGGSRTALDISIEMEGGDHTIIEERTLRFGPGGHLFGILGRTSTDRERPVIVLFNSGSVHHVGPHRLYVTLARSLASMGFTCLRFDLEGIGDSVLRTAGRENHPYPDTAVADARAALDALAKDFGYTRFIGVGLCSGAHSAFHAGLSVSEHDIGQLVLINPLAFHWTEGTTLATRQFVDVQWYKTSMRNPERWMKLLRGDVNIRRPAVVAWGQFMTLARSHYGALMEMLWPERAPRLARDLRKLIAMRRHLTFIIAEGDPGRDILMASARRTVSKALETGEIVLENIAGADHTFSQFGPRSVVIERVRAILRPVLDAPRPASPGAWSARESPRQD